MAPEMQKALMVEAVGKPLILGERPVPAPKEGEVLIKVTVVGLNPYDHLVRDQGLYVEGQLPVVPGNDIAGVVVECGLGVSADEIKPGDHVFGQSNYLLKGTSDQCGLQEFAVLDAYTVAKVPPNLTDDDGASLVCNLIAPFWAIFGKDGLALPFPFPGQEDTPNYTAQEIVIIGGGSNCGKYAVQICALAGFGTIVATANKSKNEQLLLSYGATHVVDRHASDVEAQIRAIVDDDLIYAMDAVNEDYTLGVSILSNTKKGSLVCIVPGKADESKIRDKNAGYEAKFVQGQSHYQPELAVAFWKHLPLWMQQGKIKATGWDVIEGLDRDRIDRVLSDYRDGKPPPKQIHVHL